MRVAIVNDLALARETLRRLVSSVPGYTIAWTAADGGEAVDKAARDRPDVILMDLVMPLMDGVEATRRIMAASPCPILLVTSSVSGNFAKVYEAMGYGGLDAVNTPVLGPGGAVKDSEGLLARLAKLDRTKDAATLNLPAPKSPSKSQPVRTCPPLLALGCSTGGPQALAKVLRTLPADFVAPVLVAQHIAAEFAPSMATWLAGQIALRVRVAADGDAPESGLVLLAATNDHFVLRSDGRLAYAADPADYPYRPSVDILFQSLAINWPRPGAGVLLTGMGEDGARGLLELKRNGWYTIAQDESTSVVFGMPRAAAVLGAARAVLPLPEIGPVVRTRLEAPASPTNKS
jgi:two-component system response regulator WspF